MMFKIKAKLLFCISFIFIYSNFSLPAYSADDDSSDESEVGKEKKKKRKVKNEKGQAKHQGIQPPPANAHLHILPTKYSTAEDFFANISPFPRVSILPFLQGFVQPLESILSVPTDKESELKHAQGTKRKTYSSEFLTISKLLGRDIFRLITRHLRQQDILSLLSSSKEMNDKWKYIEEFSFKKRLYFLENVNTFLNLLANRTLNFKKLVISSECCVLDKEESFHLNLYQYIRDEKFSKLMHLEILDPYFMVNRYRENVHGFFLALAEGKLKCLKHLSFSFVEVNDECIDNLASAISHGYFLNLEEFQIIENNKLSVIKLVRVLSENIKAGKIPNLTQLHLFLENKLNLSEYDATEFFNSFDSINLTDFKLECHSSGKNFFPFRALTNYIKSGKLAKLKTLSLICIYNDIDNVEIEENYAYIGNLFDAFLHAGAKNNLESLNLKGWIFINNEHHDTKFFHALSDGIFPNLKNLKIVNTYFDTLECYKFIDLLKAGKIPNLTSLDVNGNHLSGVSFVKLVETAGSRNPFLNIESEDNTELAEFGLNDCIARNFILGSWINMNIFSEYRFDLFLKVMKYKLGIGDTEWINSLVSKGDDSDSELIDIVDDKAFDLDIKIDEFIKSTKEICLPVKKDLKFRYDEGINFFQIFWNDILEKKFFKLKELDVFFKEAEFSAFLDCIKLDLFPSLKRLAFEKENLSMHDLERLFGFLRNSKLPFLKKLVIKKVDKKFDDFFHENCSSSHLPWHRLPIFLSDDENDDNQDKSDIRLFF